MDWTPIILFIGGMAYLFFSEFVKGAGNNTGKLVTDRVASHTRPRKKKRSLFKKFFRVFVIAAIIYLGIKAFPFILALI